MHPAVPDLTALLPYLDDHWRDQVITRGVDDLASIAYPANSPLTARPDWKPAKAKAGSDLERLRHEALDPFGPPIAIANSLYGVQFLFTEDTATPLPRAAPN